MSKFYVIAFAVLTFWTSQTNAQTQVNWFTFSKDYFPGTYDANNKYLGGTDLMYLVNHKGKLWAGTSVWNDNPGSDPTPGPQILYKEKSSSNWKVDTSMGPGHLRTDALYSFIFKEDKFGNPLPQPDTLLLASFSDLTAPYDVCVWVRDDQNNTWIKTTVYPNVSSPNNSYIRHMYLYEDKVTGIQHIFVAGVTAVIRGAYNSKLPGKLEWQGIEITGPERMLSSAVCNGDYYVSFGSDGNTTNNQGGIFKRNDGSSPTWSFIYEWPDTNALGGYETSFRGMTAVSDPLGGNHQVIVGFPENMRSSLRIDPVNNTQTVEVNWRSFFRNLWGFPTFTDINYSAYNNMVEVIAPDNGDTCLLAGAWLTYPDAYGTVNRNNSWYLVRRPNGSWHYGQVIDSLNLIPAGTGLQATRTIIKSPFVDEPNTYYFGGMDAGGPNPVFHNTAWIYKGVMQSPLSAQVSIGGYKVYYGHVHNHCSISDGTGTAAQAYAYARDIGHLDFFSLADHAEMVTSTEWTTIKTAADSYNQDGVFTTFWGFEWSHNTYGHVAVINSDEFCSSSNTATNSFAKLLTWMSTRECVAFFNHPGRQNSTGVEFNHFTDTPSDIFVGIELWNKTDGFSVYYYKDGYFTNDGGLSWIDEANTRGWKLGAAGAEDNHSGTWGTKTPYKMAVLANAKTRTDIMDAFKARRFFSTSDKNIGLSFTIGGYEMGSTIFGATHSYQIMANDGENEVFTQVELLKNGLVIQSWTPNTANPVITGSLLCSDGDYYYVRVKQTDGGEAIGSPIWISGGNQAPINVSAVIATGLDDVEETAAGVMYTGSTDIELVYDSYNTAGNQTVGLRFINMNIPQGVTITNAYLQFTCDEISTGSCSLTIQGEDSDNSAAFNTSAHNVSSRARTAASVSWVPPGWPTINLATADHRTPNISPVIQEIISRTGYTSASAITVIITGTGSRIAEAYEGVPASAAKLVVEYVSTPPVVPTFDQIGPLYQGSVPPGLPTTSLNGIPGAWSPSVISTVATGSTTYTFTPDPGQCATVVIMVIEVIPFNSPPSVAITSPANSEYFGAPATITINASATDTDGTIAKVQFYQGATLLGEDAASPYSYTWSGVAEGTYSLSAVAIDNLGAATTSEAVNVTVYPVTSFSKRIATGIDDVEEYSSGTITRTSSSIELVYYSSTTGNQTVGLRFTSVTVPVGAIVTNAYIQFGASKKRSGTCNLTIKGQSSSNAPSFTTTRYNVSSRVRTTASSAWSPANWTRTGAIGTDQRTPDLSAIVQEITGISGWASGNSMVFIITGSGTRTAYAYEASTSRCAQLNISYYVPSGKSGIIASGTNYDIELAAVDFATLNCYPVPFNETVQIHIELPGTDKVRMLKMTNIAGMVVVQRKINDLRFDLNTSGLPKGTYFLQVQTDQHNLFKTIIKN